MTDVFISYAREDEGRAERLANALEAEGWSVWWDRNIPFGKSFDQVIEEALASARCVLVLWSASSIGSRWVLEEAHYAYERQILVPMSVDGVAPPIGFRRAQTANLVGWDGEKTFPAFRKLLADIHGVIASGPKASRSESTESLGHRREAAKAERDAWSRHGEPHVPSAAGTGSEQQRLSRLLLVLVIIAIFFVVTLAVPDSEILSADAEIKVPLLNLPIRYANFVTFGPLALVGLLVYLHLFVEQLHRLKSRSYEPPETFLFTMHYPAAELISDAVIYGLVPAVLAWFTWKALFRQEALWLIGLTTATAFYAALLYLRHSRARTASWRRFIPWGLLILLLIASLVGTVELWRRGKEVLLQVRQLDLVGAELAEKDLRNVDLRYADLRDADLTNADLRGTTLSAADFAGAILKGVNLKDAKLVGAKLIDADLTDANLRGADLTRAEGMSSARGVGSAALEGARLIDVDLIKADLDGADLMAADLRDANLALASMRGINLRDANLRGANLGRANMETANLSNADLGFARLEGANLRGASLASADLSNANLVGADLADVNLRRANLAKADLYASSGLDAASLTGATFCETRWFDGKFLNEDCEMTSPSQKALQ